MAVKSRGPRTYDPELTRQRIVDAAVELFGTKGFDATSVQELVVTAGVTKGAFYHHFSSKEEVLHLIHDEFIDAHYERQQALLASYDTAHDRLFGLIYLTVTVIAEFQREVEVFFRERYALTGPEYDSVRAKRDAVFAPYLQALRDGVRNGEFRADVDPEVAALGIVGMANWMYQWFRAEGRLEPDEIARDLARIALRGISARPRIVERVTSQDLDLSPR